MKNLSNKNIQNIQFVNKTKLNEEDKIGKLPILTIQRNIKQKWNKIQNKMT